ncbi:hypothetical protein AB6735_21530 [Mucilaginibacter sp. RCC_168]|uniref:hypothetical protein n=1 Tax=Mucilaginibacter sp. RCC_168 TaxID=3239221 RepID=UPI0035247397
METKAQDKRIFDEVKRIILTDQDLKVWGDLGADADMLDERRILLHNFLEKISKPKDKAKRRIKPKFEYKSIELVNITAPDGLKNFEVSEQYVNDNYIHTGSNMQWSSGGGSVLYFTGQGKKVSAKWLDSQTVEVLHDKDIIFTMKRDSSYFCGDEVKVIYIAK